MSIQLGQKGKFSKTVSETDVYGFAGITGDFNPVHINNEACKGSIFGKRIAHGMLVGSFISTVLGMYMPGPGTIYMEQDLKFLKPVFYGDTVTAEVTVSEVINEDKGIYRLDTVVVNQHDERVINGYAVVKFKEANEYE